MQVRDAVAHLNPSEVRAEANKPFTIQLFAPSLEAYRDMESWLTPPDSMSAARTMPRKIRRFVGVLKIVGLRMRSR